MDEQKIRTVLEIAKVNSINKAARMLHISPQGLKIQLDTIEDELGCELFSRTRHGCFLTKKGVVFCENAPHLLKNIEAFRNAVRNAGEEHVIRIALWEGRGNVLEDAIVDAFSELNPSIEIAYVPISADGVGEDIARGAIDLSFYAEEFLDTISNHLDFIPIPDFSMSYKCILSEKYASESGLLSGISSSDLKSLNTAFIEPVEIETLRGIRPAKRIPAEKYSIVNFCKEGGICVVDEFFHLDYPGIVNTPTIEGILCRKNPSSSVELFVNSAINLNIPQLKKQLYVTNLQRD